MVTVCGMKHSSVVSQPGTEEPSGLMTSALVLEANAVLVAAIPAMAPNSTNTVIATTPLNKMNPTTIYIKIC